MHVVLGYTVVGRGAGRALWGLVGPRPARLSVWSRKLKMGPTLWANLREGKLPLSAYLYTMLQAFATFAACWYWPCWPRPAATPPTNP